VERRGEVKLMIKQKWKTSQTVCLITRNNQRKLICRLKYNWNQIEAKFAMENSEVIHA
jgi:hypothetical protein